MSTNTLRIGTRESELARQQAHEGKDILETKNFLTDLVPIKSDGDMDLIKPIYSLGIQGVFTKTLDIALLENKIDIAVHSLKDVPTQLPRGLILGAVLKRGSARDVLIYREKRTMDAPVTLSLIHI